MDYLIITKNHNGSITIKDTITDKAITYYFATVKQAEQRHRNFIGLKHKRLQRIYMGV